MCFIISCSAASERDIDAVGSAIVGGRVAVGCQWPTTVAVGACSGVLVHPALVVTAGHCLTAVSPGVPAEPPIDVRFGEGVTTPTRLVSIVACQAHAAGGSGRDWGFCRLATPVTDLPLTPIAAGCEEALVAQGRPVVIAGFGDTDDTGNGGGRKRWAESRIAAVDAERGLRVGGRGVAPCHGDSGGPAYARLADGSWRVIAVDSEGLTDSCLDGDWMAPLPPAVPWIERESGLDVTPCHDGEGRWQPGPDCGGFAAAPDSPDAAARSWLDGCREPSPAPSATSCPPAPPLPPSPDRRDPGGEGGCQLAGGEPVFGGLAALLVAGAALALTRVGWSLRGRRRYLRRSHASRSRE
jgi:hypothetical protein